MVSNHDSPPSCISTSHVHSFVNLPVAQSCGVLALDGRIWAPTDSF